MSDPIRRVHSAHPVKNHGRKARAGGFDGLPVMPARVEIRLLAQIGFFQVIRPRAGKLGQLLLQRGFAALLWVEPVE